MTMVALERTTRRPTWAATTSLPIGYVRLPRRPGTLPDDVDAFVDAVAVAAIATVRWLIGDGGGAGRPSSTVVPACKIGITSAAAAATTDDGTFNGGDPTSWTWPHVARRVSSYRYADGGSAASQLVVVALTCIDGAAVPPGLRAFGLAAREFATHLERRVDVAFERRRPQTWLSLASDAGGGGRTTADADRPTIIYVAVAHPLAARRRRNFDDVMHAGRRAPATLEQLAATIARIAHEREQRPATRARVGWDAADAEAIVHATRRAHALVGASLGALSTRSHAATVRALDADCRRLVAVVSADSTLSITLRRHVLPWLAARAAAPAGARRRRQHAHALPHVQAALSS